jgi:PTH1 family peptidyl-tRNA hydrolase
MGYAMLLFVGLGNPGGQYAQNRHNIGFMAVDAIIRRYSFGPDRQKFSGIINEGTLAGEKIVVLRPLTFMNNSGQSVGAALRFYKLTPDHVVVFHDELDLAPGKVRIKRGGGHAGHNGLRSMDEHIGKDYRRVRLGIGHPGDRDLVIPYVLGNFFKADADWLRPLFEAVAEAAPLLNDADDNKFTTAVAAKLQPEKKSPAKRPDAAGTSEES